MRMSLVAAGAAVALLSAGAATAQYGGQSNQPNGQTDVPSARHQNSAHANAPGTPDQTNGGGMQDNSAGMSGNDQNRMKTGATMPSDQDRMGTKERTRINENGNRTNIRLTTTQRTRIKDVIVRAHGPRLTNVNFRIGVGVRVPRDVRIAVLPPEIIAIAPEWQGYSYFEYGDQIVIVDPVSFAIVATLPL